MSALLEVRDIRKAYGAIRAVDGVSFDVQNGEILGVIGPNGSGKTTMFNAILGQVKPDAGQVMFEGADVSGIGALALSRRGIGRTFQSLQVFTGLSVRDNLIVAGQEFVGSAGSRLFARPDAGMGRRADEIIDLFRIGHVRHGLGIDERNDLDRLQTRFAQGVDELDLSLRWNRILFDLESLARPLFLDFNPFWEIAHDRSVLINAIASPAALPTGSSSVQAAPGP